MNSSNSRPFTNFTYRISIRITLRSMKVNKLMDNKLILTSIKSRKVRFHCIIFFLFAFSIFVMSCSDWIMVKPSFNVRGVTLSQISSRETNFLLDLDVKNPNKFDLTLKSFEYTICLDNEEIGNGQMEKELLISSSSTTKIRVPLVLYFKDLSGCLEIIFTGHDLPYKIYGTASVSMVFGSLKFPFSKEGRINLKYSFLKCRRKTAETIKVRELSSPAKNEANFNEKNKATG